MAFNHAGYPIEESHQPEPRKRQGLANITPVAPVDIDNRPVATVPLQQPTNVTAPPSNKDRVVIGDDDQLTFVAPEQKRPVGRPPKQSPKPFTPEE